MNIEFVKMHGLGNDYIVLDAIARPDLEALDLSELSIRVSRRRFDVGSDGLILLVPPTSPDADVRMRIWNSDGSEAEMCGNGIRCLARLAVERGYTTGDALNIETRGGLKRATIARDDDGEIVGAAIDMGEPTLDVRALPVDLGRLGDPIEALESGPGVYLVGNRPFGFVGVGNPHAVCYLDRDPADIDLEREGQALEHDPAFPERMNIHFAFAARPDCVVLRTWERGAGATLACGTGACATLVAGVLLGRTNRQASLVLPGGELDIHWDESSGHVFKAGPAEHVCDGVVVVVVQQPVASTP